MLKLIFSLLIVLAPAVMARDVITNDSGGYAEAPNGYKAVFVPKNTGAVLIQQKEIAIKAPDFTADDEPEPTPTPRPVFDPCDYNGLSLGGMWGGECDE